MRSIENNNEKKKKVLKIVGLVALFLLVFGLSYALFRITLTGKKKTKITTANFGITLTDINGNEEEEGIAVNLDKAVPEEDSEGLKREGYKFVVTNTGNVPASYELKLDSTGTLSDECIKYALKEKDYLKRSDNTYYMGGIYSNEATIAEDENGNIEGLAPVPLLSSISNDTLDKTTLLPGEKIEYELKLWVKEDATVDEASNKTYEANVVVEGYQAKEYMSGKTGDTSKYTLYKDGTLAITGSGAIEECETSDVGATLFNNGGAIFGPVVKILKDMGYELDISNGLDMTGENGYDSFVLYIMTVALYDGIVDNDFYNDYSLIGNDMQMIMEEYFGSEENAIAAFNEVRSHKITRIVIDEGLTNTEKIGFTTLMGDYMFTMPSTLLNSQSLLISSYEYIGYGLILPPDFTTLNTDISEYLRYIDLSNVETIGYSVISFRYMKELTIPNNVTSVEENAIYAYHDMVINIDNTREYVEANWDSNWLDANGYNVTVNYLR